MRIIGGMAGVVNSRFLNFFAVDIHGLHFMKDYFQNGRARESHREKLFVNSMKFCLKIRREERRDKLKVICRSGLDEERKL